MKRIQGAKNGEKKKSKALRWKFRRKTGNFTRQHFFFLSYIRHVFPTL